MARKNKKNEHNFQGPNLVRPLQSAGSRTLLYPRSTMPQISIEDFGILLSTKNAKSNNIEGYYLVSHRVISTPSDAQRVYRCPEMTFILLQNYVSASNMLL